MNANIWVERVTIAIYHMQYYRTHPKPLSSACFQLSFFRHVHAYRHGIGHLLTTLSRHGERDTSQPMSGGQVSIARGTETGESASRGECRLKKHG